MKIWEGIFLGFIQGLTEFLPVSSSGHLLLFEKIGVGNEDLFFNVCMHVGTLFSVLIAMRKTWFPLVRHPLQKTNLHLVLSCLPTVALALVFKVFLPGAISGDFLPLGFMLTTVFMFAGEKLCFAKNKGLSYRNALLSGVFQGIAVLPGISRSGATITALRLTGIDKESASTFSFLMSIPIIIGSLVLETIELVKGGFSFENYPVLPLIFGTLTATLSGYLAIRFFLDLIKKKSLLPFGIYTFALSIISFVVMYA